MLEFGYTREAHPGENYRHHSSPADKRANARASEEHSKVRRPILLDDLAGTAHRAYGLLPNMTFIVLGGRIFYKATWTVAGDVAAAVESILDCWRDNDPAAFRAGLERAWPQAVSDFTDEAGPNARTRRPGPGTRVAA